MSRYIEKAKELRSDPALHCNCAQAVILPFAEEAGISEETARKLASNFGGGMKMASICGTVTGAAMVLGLFGMDDPRTLNQFYKMMKDNHEGHLDCASLLRINREKGGEKKAHCDAMIYESIGNVETILREKGLLQ
ncbi:MAG: C_GCAxxG_C_C family protein [Solobacterium sp.]|nr:C_GCAxxG_C_C family protein [Solobacterium sp.]